MSFFFLSLRKNNRHTHTHTHTHKHTDWSEPGKFQHTAVKVIRKVQRFKAKVETSGAFWCLFLLIPTGMKKYLSAAVFLEFCFRWSSKETQTWRFVIGNRFDHLFQIPTKSRRSNSGESAANGNFMGWNQDCGNSGMASRRALYRRKNERSSDPKYK